MARASGEHAGLPDLPEGLRLHRLSARPDLIEGVHALGARVWPRFMLEGPCGEAFYEELDSTFADCALVVTDPEDRVVCRALWIPFAFDGTLPLSERGWDWVVEKGIADRRAGVACTAASALEIGIDPSFRGRDLSGILLAHMRAAVAGADLEMLFAPVRPSRKSEVPALTMTEYLDLFRSDGLPEDPWLRVHARAGGQILGPCERSMTISGSVEDWQEWTGVDMSRPGAHEVPGALSLVSSEGERAVYTEPNVWVLHQL